MAGASFSDLLQSYQRKYPLEVLYVEDDLQSAFRVKEVYESDPIRFSIRRNALDADNALRDKLPDIVVTDLRLGGHDVTGEQWLVSNLDKLISAKKVLLTGFATDIANRSRLRVENVDIISKGEPEEFQLWDEQLQRLSEEKAARVIRGLASEVLASGSGQAGVSSIEAVLALSTPINRLFSRWCGKFQNQEKRRVVVDGSFYSIRDLLLEVQRGSEVGVITLEMFLEDLEDFV